MRFSYLFLVPVLLACNTNKHNSSYKEAYKIINNSLDLYVDLHGTTLETESRINPHFVGFYPNYKYVDSSLVVISSLGHYDKNTQHCSNPIIPSYKVDLNREYYKEPLTSIGRSIDFRKLTNNIYKPYKEHIEQEENIEAYQSITKDTVHFSKKRIDGQCRYFLSKENGYFELSYPLFSYNKKEAVILISTNRIGYELWFFENINGSWERSCYINRGSID